MQDTRTIVVEAGSVCGMELQNAQGIDTFYEGVWRVVSVTLDKTHPCGYIMLTAKLVKISKPSIADLKITIDASAVTEATAALDNLAAAADRAREAMGRLQK